MLVPMRTFTLPKPYSSRPQWSVRFISFYCHQPEQFQQLNRSQGQHYLTTDGQSACLSWCQAIIWERRPIFLSFPWKLSSDICGSCYPLWWEDTSVSYSCNWVSPTQVGLGAEPRGTHNHILLAQFWQSPNLEGKVPASIPRRDRAAQYWVCYCSVLYNFKAYEMETLLVVLSCLCIILR
jgi:hypothetical protein